jgi:hypothetical protein
MTRVLNLDSTVEGYCCMISRAPAAPAPQLNHPLQWYMPQLCCRNENTAMPLAAGAAVRTAAATDTTYHPPHLNPSSHHPIPT